MKSKIIIVIGGILNSILALFHIFLAYQIYQAYSGQNFYPLMQMLNVGGSLMIFFFAFTSLVYAGELTKSKAGKSIIVLNIILYITRTIGDFVLFPGPNVLIIIVCLFIAALYSTAYYLSFKEAGIKSAVVQ